MMMKAVTQDRYGPPEVLELREIPRPEPGAGEMLVRVRAGTVTLADCAFRSADPFIVRFFGGLFAPKRNTVLGGALAGEVAAVGSGVTRFVPGDRVFGAVMGAHAEFVCVPETAALVPTPAGLEDGEAAGLAYGVLTAMPFLRDEARLEAGQSILINGAASSIGLVATQLARHFGAVVSGVCSARNAGLVSGLGADRVIDREQEDFTTAREAYDVIFDAVGKSSFSRCRRALKPGGIYLTTVPSLGIVFDMLWRAKAARRRAKLATTGLRSESAKTADLALIDGLLASGALRPVVDRRFPLAEAAAAHRYVETGRKAGDVVLEVAAG